MPRTVYFINTLWETPWSCCLSLAIVSTWVSYHKYLKLASLYKRSRQWHWHLWVFPEHSNTVQVMVAKKHRRQTRQLFQGQPAEPQRLGGRLASVSEQSHLPALLRRASVLEEVAHFHLSET